MVSSFLALAGIYLAGMPQDRELYGKSQAQVAEMPYAEWMEYVSTQEDGNSTLGMTFAMGFYRESLQKKNDQTMRSWTPSRRGAMTNLRQNLRDYSAALRKSDYILSGSGSMYLIFIQNSQAESEILIQQLVTGKLPSAPRRVVSDVTKVLDLRTPPIRSHENVEERRELFTSLREARGHFDQIVALLRTRPRAESDLVLEWCRKEAEPSETL
ncbi:MAG: hypothetical protein MUC92_10695 [Fimbriimonadaceae bacterium]|jgi:hypothetical protein|nr:hypothetical protein [Fimbriimonadaceae bacterium]